MRKIEARSLNSVPFVGYHHLKANTTFSNGTLSVSHANQSLLVVGSNPIPLTFQIPNASATQFISTYTAFTLHSHFFVPSVSYRRKTSFVDIIPVSGFLKSMKTIIMLNIWSVFPDMYIMIAFIGSALAGARASSQDFLSLRVSVSARVGGLRAGVLEEAPFR